MKHWRISFALQISLLYALIGGFWILLSDRVAAVLFSNPAYFVLAQTYKGWFFILITAVLLFILVTHESRTRISAEQQYGELFEKSVEGIFRSNPDERFIRVNPAMTQIFGYSSPEEMLNMVNDISTQIHLSRESRQRFIQLLNKNGIVEEFEAQNIRKDGSIFWTSTNARCVRDENGNILYYEGFVSDITSRKIAEQSLQETEARYRAVVEQMPAAVYTDAPKGSSPNYFSSPQILGITGYSAEEWMEDPELWIKLLHPEDRQRVLEESERTNISHEPFDIEYRIISHKGKVVWIHDRATLICDEKDNPRYWQGLLIDITTQKHAEDAIRASEARYHSLVEDASDAIFISDAKGKYFEVNQRACDMLGYSRSDLLNFNIRDLLTPEELAIRPLKPDELSTGRTTVAERLLIRKDGNMVPVELSTKMLPDGMVMSIARDITERRVTQETLAHNEKRYRALIEHSMDAIALYSPEGKILYQSPASLNILGYLLSEMLGRSVFDFIHPEDQEIAEREFHEIMKSPGTHSTSELRCKHKDGTVKWLEFINTNRIDEPGVNAIVSNYRDITARKATEESLRSAESRYRALVENMSPVVYADAVEDLVTFYISPQIHTLLGYLPEEWLADEMSWFKCLHPEDCERINQKIEHCKKTGEVFLSDYRMIARDGSVVWVRDQSSLVRDENGNPLYWQGVFLNISEQKQAEAELRKTELRYRVLVEKLPAVVFMDIYNQPLGSQYMSPRLIDLVGYTPDEWVKADNLWENSLHSDDRERVLAEDIRTDQTGEPFKIEYRLRARDGHYVWVREEAYMIRGEDGTPQYWQGILLNITEQKQVQEALQRREAILEAVGFAAEQFLKSSNWEDCLPQVLAHIGKNTQTSRVYVFKKHFAPDDSLLISQHSEWCDAEIEPQVDNPVLQNMNFAQAGYSRWIRLFNDGLPVYGIVKELPPEELGVFSREGILSILCFPIQVGNDWWGFIGFDDCENEREWSAIEIEALRAAVSTLGAAIQRKITEEAVFKGETSYQGLFNSVSDAIYIQNIEGRFLDVNDGAVRMYRYPKPFFTGKTLDALSAADKNDMGEVQQAFQRALQGEPQHFEFWGMRSNGEVFPKEVHLYKGLYFGDDVVIAIAQDITERKRAEDALQRQLEELTVLHAIAQAESSAENSDELIQRVTNIIGDTLYTDNCGVLLLNPSGTALEPHLSYRGASPEVLSTRFPVTEGISGKVITTRTAFRTGDVSKVPSYFEVTKGIRSEVCVPISSGEKILGVLNVESKKADAFTDTDERLINTIADGMATALEKLQLFESEKRRRKEAETLREATSTLTTSLELPLLFESILDAMENLVHYDSASINLEDSGELVIVAARRLPENINFIGKRYQGAGKWAKIARDRKPIIVADAQTNELFEKWEGTEYIRGWIGVPLIAQDKFIGLLNLDSRTVGAFTEENAILLQTFANQAAVAIQNGRLFEVQLRRRQQADALREATAELTSSVEPHEVFETILSIISKLVPSKSSSIEVIHGDFIEIVAQHGLPKDHNFVGLRYPYRANIWGMELWKPVIISDVQVDERFEKLQGTEYIHGWMGVPLITENKLIGYLNLDSDQFNYFTEEHAETAQTLANQAAIAIEKARIFEEEKQRSRIIQVLAEIANEIAITGEVTPLFEKIAQRTSDLLHASHVAIYLLQDDGITIRPVIAHGTFSNEILSHLFKIGEGITGGVMASGKSEIINDTTNDPRRIRVPGTPEEDGIQETMMSSPLIIRGKSIGAINAWRLKSAGLFNESELNFLISIAQQASITIEAGRLFQETIRRGQESAAIAEVGRDISATLQLDVVLERIAVYAKELLKSRTSAVYLSEPTGQVLRAIAAIGEEADEIKNDPLQIGSGILGNIAKSKIGEIVNDTISDPRAITIKGTEQDPDEHLMGVPVLSKDQLTGLLVVWRSGADMNFQGSDLEFLDGLAQQAAVAIENARLFQSEQKRRQEAENLRVAATAITSTLEPGQVLETILLALQQVVQYDSAAIFQLEGETVRITAAKGFLDDISAINQVFPANIDLFQKINQTGKPVILWDRQDYREFQQWIASSDMRGWMGVPLIARGRVVGFITLDSLTPGAFTDNDASLAQSFAHQASVAMENARLFTETRQRMEELQVVSRVSFSLRVARDSEEMLPILLNEIKQSMDTDSAAIWLYDSDKDELILKVSSGILANLPKPNFKTEEGIVGTVYASGMIHLTSEFIKDPKTTAENARIFDGEWGGITVPIRTTSETIGVLSVAMHKAKMIESHQVRLMTTIAEIAGNAIYRSDLYEKSEEQVRRLITLREMDTAISSSFDLRVTLEILNEHLLTKMGVSAVAILTLNPDTQMLDFYSGSGFRNQEALRSPIQAGDELAGQILVTQKDIYIPNLEQSTKPAHANMILREGFVSYYGVPMQSKGLTNGVLETYFRHSFTPNSDWIEFLHTLAGQATIAIDSTRLFENLQRSNQELTLAYDTTLEGWAKALELRDKETEGHTRRVTELTLKLARKMNIPESQMTHIRRGVLVHDIGKMGVPDNILRKEGALTDEEWVEMRKHPQHAFDLLYPIHYLRPALDIAYYHHEWWDGSGYPSGLKGNNIPLPARIFAVVDVWDALLSDRPYRTSWKKQKVIHYIRGLSGKQFDPHAVDVFLKMMKASPGKSKGKTFPKIIAKGTSKKTKNKKRR